MASSKAAGHDGVRICSRGRIEASGLRALHTCPRLVRQACDRERPLCHYVGPYLELVESCMMLMQPEYRAYRRSRRPRPFMLGRELMNMPIEDLSESPF